VVNKIIFQPPMQKSNRNNIDKMLDKSYGYFFFFFFFVGKKLWLLIVNINVHNEIYIYCKKIYIKKKYILQKSKRIDDVRLVS
jgi:hypothetical protein